MPDKVDPMTTNNPPDEVHRAHNEKSLPEIGCLRCERYEIGLRRLMRLSYEKPDDYFDLKMKQVRREIRKILRRKP